MTTLRERLQASLGSTYTLEHEIHGGGMASVFVAEEVALGRKVVVKALPDVASEVSPERFAREVRIAARLQHPHIVPVFTAGDTAGIPFYTMPLIDGESLRGRLARGPLAIRETIDILRDVSKALAFAHERGVVHRDIKPDNVLLTHGSAVVTDFGIAKAVADSQLNNGTAPTLTQVGLTMGTPAYMAPEQAVGDPNIDCRADLYALGCMAYEMLAGTPPFTGRNAAALIVAHLTQQPVPIFSHRPDVPSALAAALSQCLEKDPAERPANASDILPFLETAAMELSGAHAAAAPVRPVGTEPVVIARSEVADRSLVVLPFVNSGTERDDEYFADGLTEELIAELSRMRELRVISRTSSMQLKQTKKAARAIARELGVTFTVGGTVRRSGSRLRITAQLIHADTDTQRWSDRYDGTMDDVFDVQERVARAIAGALDAQLTEREEKRLGERVIRDPNAFDLFLQARRAARRWGDGPHRALELIDRALAIEGDSATLRLLGAWARVAMVRAGAHRDFQLLDDAEREAREILARTPESPSARGVLGFSAFERGDLEWAVLHFVAALRREPNDPDMLFFLGLSYLFAGQYDAASDIVRRMIDCDPLTEWPWLLGGAVRWYAGQFEEGMALHRRAVATEPESPGVRWGAGYIAALMGRLAETAAEADFMERADPQRGPYTRQLRALLQGLRGDRAGALETLRAVDTSLLDHHLSFHICEAYAVAGEEDRALDVLGHAVSHGYFPYPFLAEHCPFIASLRRSKRFAEILEIARRRSEAFMKATSDDGVTSSSFGLTMQ